MSIASVSYGKTSGGLIMFIIRVPEGEKVEEQKKIYQEIIIIIFKTG